MFYIQKIFFLAYKILLQSLKCFSQKTKPFWKKPAPFRKNDACCRRLGKTTEEVPRTFLYLVYKNIKQFLPIKLLTLIQSKQN